MTVCKKAVVGNVALTILYDQDPPNPRTEWDNFGTMVCWHGRLDLGDKHSYDEPRDFLESVAGQLTDLTEEHIRKMNSPLLFELINRHGLIIPIHGYEHGSMTIKVKPFNDPWDSGQIGWIWASKHDIRKEFGVKRISQRIMAKAKDVLEYEIKEYDQYLQGEVFGYTLEVDGEQEDSCWGFFGIDHIEKTLASELSATYPGLVENLEYVN